MLVKRNTIVLGISTDSVFAHKIETMISPNGRLIDYPMLQDRNGEIAKSYGVYNGEAGVAYRGLFFIDPEQRLRTYMVYDTSTGRSTVELLRELDALQYADGSDRAAQADWYPGYQGILPQWKDVGKY